MNVIELLQSFLVAILITSAVGKVRAWVRDEDPWPQVKNFLWLHVPLLWVVVAEVIVILLYLTPSYVKPVVSGMTLGLLFLGFAVASFTLKGQKCACFGSHGNTIGWSRIIMNTAAGLLAFGMAISGLPEGTTLERSVQVTVLSIMLFIAFAVRNAVMRKKFEGASNSDGAALYLIMAPGCAACDALKRLIRNYDLRGTGLRTLDYASEEDRKVIHKLSPEIGTPAIVAVRGSDTVGVPEITMGAGACYAQIKKMADVVHT